jgi:hypothetical protein
VLADEVRRDRRGALGVSGVRVRVSCSAAGELGVDVARDDGTPLGANERIIVAAMDSLVIGSVFAAVPGANGTVVPADAPVLREVVEDWLRARGGRLAAADFVRPDRPRWQYVDRDLAPCLAR